MDNQSSNSEKVQSETGPRNRGIESLVVNTCSSSPLFYTVSGGSSESQLGKQKKYYYEQLGCPSILKPSFRDLPGCTRLSSVNVPSTSYRQFPLDKLNTKGSIMGKSPTSSSLGKREKYISPIKVNTKIRHMYSHTSTSDSSTISQQSSITSFSTQTSDYPEKDDTVNEKYQSSITQAKDAFTSMSPPPSSRPNNSNNASDYFDPSDPQRLFTVPPAYAGKLEDLEKITGHIVIQRFFTRAFGIWLEKQLGMNSKSIGIDTSETIFDNENDKTDSQQSSAREGRILEKILEVDDAFNSDSSTEGSVIIKEVIKECSVNDFIKCECFLTTQIDSMNDYNKIESSIIQSSKNIIILEPSNSLQQPLEPFEKELLDQCKEYEILNNKNDTSSVEPKLQDENVVHEEEISNETELRLSKCLIESVLMELEDANNSKESPRRISDIEDDDDGPVCIPDIIDVSHLYKFQSRNSSEKEETTLSESQLYSQHKVAEYLGKLEITQSKADSVGDDYTENNLLNLISSPQPIISIEEDEEMRGESSLQAQQEYEQQLQEIDENRIKRSVSADSCIGTESSGETRNTSTTTTTTTNNNISSILNDSGILLDSGRMEMEILEESESSEPSQQLKLTHDNGDAFQNEKRSLLLEESQEEKVVKEIQKLNQESVPPPPLITNKSVDDYSRSDLSSGLKQSDEGDDADQSESDSELAESSLLRKISVAETELSTMIENVELEGKQIQQQQRTLRENFEMDELDLMVEDVVLNDGDLEDDDEEQDQFDTIIESHEKEKEKRLRPICRKRNVSTQTTRSVESCGSQVSSCGSSRSTTATSDSSFDLEFISKSKKYISHIPSTSATIQETHSGHHLPEVRKQQQRSSYLPSSTSGLNVLNMKFTMGKEFESEVSIRIPPKSPLVTTGGDQGNHTTTRINNQSQTLPIISCRTRGQKLHGQDHHDLKNLWSEVKSKMDTRVGESALTLGERDLQVRGRRMSLLSSSAEIGSDVNTNKSQQQDINFTTTTASRFPTFEDDKIKRSLKRLKKILDD